MLFLNRQHYPYNHDELNQTEPADPYKQILFKGYTDPEITEIKHLLIGVSLILYQIRVSYPLYLKKAGGLGRKIII
ncbi:MAG TPA: hypothetical protein DEA78_07175 [Cyanobacteria bacterium UBA11159]|nr:hypothetical protein [Cyanobacteria bacterium UBA11367]HBE58464.1 hypothetical protein [Cyanobacteria bacterium UBA11366]HBK62747.1 hypothetical protein [Cyanobacteria bacterium UBA11166]HBR73491.1 hypothetical protein [Cyanobacteria bacterium UBA11159]HBS71824.1 hypothetical protein [Cyanobacteria bacterium UBA11153]HCA94248.1 hypothetical protein [Cyanobacteria bacterium UBA9226]